MAHPQPCAGGPDSKRDPVDPLDVDSHEHGSLGCSLAARIALPRSVGRDHVENRRKENGSPKAIRWLNEMEMSLCSSNVRVAGLQYPIVRRPEEDSRSVRKHDPKVRRADCAPELDDRVDQEP